MLDLYDNRFVADDDMYSDTVEELNEAIDRFEEVSERLREAMDKYGKKKRLWF